jgi:hypothetical protein
MGLVVAHEVRDWYVRAAQQALDNMHKEEAVVQLGSRAPAGMRCKEGEGTDVWWALQRILTEASLLQASAKRGGRVSVVCLTKMCEGN